MCEKESMENGIHIKTGCFLLVEHGIFSFLHQRRREDLNVQ